MRFTIAYYLVLIYIIVMIRPLIPFIGDICSHEFNELVHISTVHAKYGNHHLEKELGETNSDNGNSKNQNTPRSEDQAPYHIISPVYTCDLSVKRSSAEYPPLQLRKLLDISILYPGKPPKFS